MLPPKIWATASRHHSPNVAAIDPSTLTPPFTMSSLTPTALSRWSCDAARALPAISTIRSIHIYDFDNTLFGSPLPNKQLWNTGTCGQLQAQEFMTTGGWWHNPDILAATGNGLQAEEARAWAGSWNEKIVELVQLTMEDRDALSVLLTGRSESGFSSLIKRMLAAKGLSFDMVCLKPTVSPAGETFSSTMFFKQALLRDIVFTYSQANEIRIYEDRIKHVKAFRDYFSDLNRSLLASTSTTRAPITAEVIHVQEAETHLNPETEVVEVQKMINVNNSAILARTAPPGTRPWKIKRSVFYTGYLISDPDIERLRKLIQLPEKCAFEHDLRLLANNILITPRPAPRSILDKVGGMGARLRWKVTGTASLENRIWAARVAPVNGEKIYTENSTPMVVLATRRATKPMEAGRIANWQPVSGEQAIEFETVVGEKVLLRIEEEVSGEDEYEASFPNGKNARKHPREDDGREFVRPAPSSGRGIWNGNGNARGGGRGGGGGQYSSPRGGFQQRGGGDRGRGGGRGGRGGGRGRGGNEGRGGGGGGGRGRGGRGGYRSLDDNVGQGYGGGGMQY